MKGRMVKSPEPRFLVMKGLLLGMALWWMVGCVTAADGRARAIEADYGRSVTNNRMEMMTNPPDAVDPRPAVGMPPQSAKNIQERYDKSFKEKEEPPTVRMIIR